MFSLLLAITYLAFIGLGLPDSLLGAAWPVIHEEFGVALSLQGIVTMIIAGGTIVSSLMSDKLTRKFGAGVVTAVSVLLTALAMIGFSFSTEFWHLCALAVPYGLGAGAVDAALNNFAALHFSSRHMNWLHCFWGVGASVSPYIMGACLSGGIGWHWGYRIVGLVQVVLTAVLFFSLPLWKKSSSDQAQTATLAKPSDKPLAVAGVWQTLVMFFAYCSAEATAMNWSSSYLVTHRGVDANLAATFASLFFLGITFGRFVCGLFSEKLGNKRLIRIGVAVMAVAVVAIVLPLSTNVVALCGLVLFGLGCAPVYPAVIHATPYRFGEGNSQAIVGFQMASAYVGTTFMPPLFGLIAKTSPIAFPLFLGGFVLLLVIMSEVVNKVVANRSV